MARITGTLHEDKYAFMIISRATVVLTRNIADKIVGQIKAHIFENRIVYEIMLKNTVQPGSHRWQYNTAHTR